MNNSRLAIGVALGSLALCSALLIAQDSKPTPPVTKTPAAKSPTAPTTPKLTTATPPTTKNTSTSAPVLTTPPEGELPPGVTPEMMQEAMVASTPGPMQAYLVASAGEWEGECKMWMAPNTPPSTSTSFFNVTPVLGGRFIHQDTCGDLGEWGKFEGTGLIGYDIAKGEFQATWADTMGTGIMYGTGQLSSDEKVLTINYNYFCPMQKKNCAFRQTTTRNDNGTSTMRMWGPAMGTGDEYQLMEIVYTRKHSHKHTTHATHSEKGTAAQ